MPDPDLDEVPDLEPEPDPDLPNFEGFLEGEEEAKELIVGNVLL